MSTATRFGNFFRQRRQILGLSLREFCRRNGFDPGNISRLERGLLTPPHSAEVLESYAKALKLASKSQEWHAFFDLAAAETGRIPHQMAEDQTERERLPERFRAWRNQRTRYGWTKATDLELWADYLDARAQLPRLVRRLIHGTVESIQHIEFPAEEGIQRPGWDGIVETANGNSFVPSGLSVWELGVDRDPGRKAEDDFRKRTKNPLGLDPSQTCFIFVTPRKWLKKTEWRDKKRKLGIWKDVRVYDSANLEEWLETALGTDVWIARLLGRRPDEVIDVEEYWANLSALTQPSLKPEVFLTSREEEIKNLTEWLKGPPSSLAFEASSPTDVIDFLAAYTASLNDSDRDQRESRMVIVEKIEAWHVLCAANNPLVLIPKPQLSIEAEMVAEAVRHGHHVLLCSHRFVGERTNTRELPRPYRYDLEKALVSSGINEEEASRLAREAGGSLTVLKRRLTRFPSARQPEWSQPRNAQDLVPILLAGGWDEANTGDHTIIAKLAGRSYEEVSATAHLWLASEDPPLIRLLTRWSLVSHEDSWLLLAQHITRSQLDLFEEVVVEVLGESDPRYDLPPNERWRAGVHDKLPKYSGQLRTGIAETLALLGAKLDWLQDVVQPARRAENVVRRLLKDAPTWKRWASLSSHLPVLAEASPEAFLDAIEADLRSKEPQLPYLFVDEGEPLLSSCTHAGLLWALETLAWKPSLLTQVSLALAHLAQIDLGGRWANRPITSLQEIFLPWLPQTTAPVEQRIKVLKILAQKAPDIGWRLLLDLLPTLHSTSHYTRHPHWHEWALNWPRGATNSERWTQVEACAALLVDLVDTDLERQTERWIHVIEKFENFPPPAQDRLILRLRELGVETLDTIARKRITEELRGKINKHRSFPDARWVLPTEKLDELEVIKERFEPQDLITQHAWLFSTHPRLIADRQDSWEQRQEKLFLLRQDALHEIFSHNGLQGMLTFAEAADHPDAVGFVLGKGRFLKTESPVIPSLLTSENQKIAEFALGYCQGRFADVGWEWIEQIGLSQWMPEQAGRFLAFVPDSDRKTWEFVEQLGADTLKEYWSRTLGFRHDASTEDVEYAVSMLLKYHRPFSAVKMLDMTSSNHDIASSLMLHILEAGLKLQEQKVDQEPPPQQISYEIQQLFVRLQSDPNVDIQRLAALEWGYLGLLDGHSTSPEILLRLLRTEPRLFADLLSLIFRSDKEAEESTETPTKEQKARAENAYRLLTEWKSVPGLQEDNTVDEQELLAWVTETRRLCEESGRLVICDLCIGEVLAYAPAEPGGSWPCVPVRDIIEEVNSEALLRGFEIGIFNKRGVFTKSPISGGEQERTFAQQYTSYAEACAIEWPITATALRRVARQYKEDARREDEEAKERSLR